MKSMIKYFLLILLVLKINTLLPPEKREELLNKYAKKITKESSNSDEDISYNKNFKDDQSIKYNVETIKGILNTYGFPQNYNYLESHAITPNIKDQGKCGCCWSHSATTALAYRFKLKQVDVDLSPQDALSCYLPDCDFGNYLIDPQLNLIKNGTVTEKCLPFSSGEGIIKSKCPEKQCEDGSIPKKYFSQNAFSTDDQVTSDTFYSIITLIIDQLNSKGPVVAGIGIYSDFMKMHSAPNKCHNTIYKYDGKSAFEGGHAVTIVGYGLTDNKFYWLIQNSWGKEACLDGFVKIEFGQVGVENVAFAEPYIEPEEGTQPLEVNLRYDKMDGYCNIQIKGENEKDFNNWKNTIELNFVSDDSKSNFNFQCGVAWNEKYDDRIGCYFEMLNIYKPRKKYKFKGYQSLGKDNTFNLGSTTSNIKDFEFFGYDTSLTLHGDQQSLFISEEGSKIVLLFDVEDFGKEYLPPIFPDEKSNNILSDCKRVIIEDYNLIICELKKNEIDYFEYYQVGNKKEINYNILCGAREPTNTFVNKIDKEKSPVFKVKDFHMEKTMNLSSETNITMVTKVEGAITSDYNSQMMVLFTSIEYNKKNETFLLLCTTGDNVTNYNEHKMECELNIPRGETKNYNKLYIYPYIIPYYPGFPYEIYMKDIIIKNNEFNPEPAPVDISQRINLSLFVMLLIAFLI